LLQQHKKRKKKTRVVYLGILTIRLSINFRIIRGLKNREKKLKSSDLLGISFLQDKFSAPWNVIQYF
jgi:hypothetical protein